MSHCCLIDRQCGFYVWGGLTCFIDSVRERLTTAAVCLADRTAMENQQATGTMAYGERWPMLLQAQTCTHTLAQHNTKTHTQGLRKQQTCSRIKQFLMLTQFTSHLCFYLYIFAIYWCVGKEILLHS